jgi:uncharacterized protein (TIGR03000 family)
MSRVLILGNLTALLLIAAPLAAQNPPKRTPASFDPPPLAPAPPSAGGFDPNRPASGQYFNGGVPISGFIPGGNFAPGNTINFNGPRGTATTFNYGGFYGGYGLPYSPYGVNAYAPSYYGAYYAPYYLPFTTPIGSNDIPAPPLTGAGVGPITNVKLTGLPAELSIQFPADATVWVNNKQVQETAAKSFELTSPSLTPGMEFTFDVRAEWTADGQAYEYSRTVKVPAGDRSKITVLAGTPKK